ncbi:hypothetical protein CBL_06181 [Carabus blaptoides fortunei]
MIQANITLVCGVQAVPEPKLSWKYEYLPLDPKTLNEKYSGDVRAAIIMNRDSQLEDSCAIKGRNSDFIPDGFTRTNMKLP